MCLRRVKVKELVWWCIWLRLLSMTALLMRHWKRVLYVIVLQTTGSLSSKYFKYHQPISTYLSFNDSISYTNSSWSSQWIRSSLVQGIRRCSVPSHYQTNADWVGGRKQRNWKQNTYIFIHGNALKNVFCKISSAISFQLQCLSYSSTFFCGVCHTCISIHLPLFVLITLITENLACCDIYQDHSPVAISYVKSLQRN